MFYCSVCNVIDYDKNIDRHLKHSHSGDYHLYLSGVQAYDKMEDACKPYMTETGAIDLNNRTASELLEIKSYFE